MKFIKFTDGDLLEVVGIHVERLVHGLGGTRHVRQHEHAGVGGLRGDELFRDEVHAVAQRCYEADVGVAVERGEPLHRDRAVQVADRRPPRGREAAVHLAHQLIEGAGPHASRQGCRLLRVLTPLMVKEAHRRIIHAVRRGICFNRYIKGL